MGRVVGVFSGGDGDHGTLCRRGRETDSDYFREGPRPHPDSWPRGIFRAGLQIPEDRADRIAFVQFNSQLLDVSRTGRSHIHGRFAGLDLNDVLVRLDLIAHFHEQVDNSGLGDGLAELRHDDRYGGHRVKGVGAWERGSVGATRQSNKSNELLINRLNR